MTESSQPSHPSGGEPERSRHPADIGVDWWATIVAGAIVALAVADVLPKIPW